MAKTQIKSNIENDPDRMPPSSNMENLAPIRPINLGESVETTHSATSKRPKRKNLGIRATKRSIPLSRRIARMFLNDDSRDIGSYIIQDILIPAAKAMISESIQSGIEMFLYGEVGAGRKRSSRERGSTNVSYGSYYREQNNRREEPRQKRFSRSRFNLDEITFENGSEASDVLAALCDQIEEYDVVSVAEFYDYAGIDGATWADNKWGWSGSDLSKAYVTHSRYGYIIVLPEPKELE